MAKYIHLSRIYLGDEEIYELLAPRNVKHRHLLRIARRRGLMFSEKSNDSDVRAKLAILPSDYPTIFKIYESIAKPDPEERSSGVRVPDCGKNDLAQIAQGIRDERAARCGENYNITQIGPSAFRIETTYTDLDPSRATVYSRRERKAVVEVAQEGDVVSIQHSATDRAKEIVAALKVALEVKPGTTKKEQLISLAGVRDPKLRTKFFLDLIRSIPGYKYQNTTHLSVDRRFQKEEPIEEEEETEEEVGGAATSRAAEQIKGLINKLALTGEQVMATEIYQQAAASDYYIANVCWSCEDQKDSRFHVDFEAGFKDPIKADEFTFDVTRRWQFKPEAPDEEQPLPMTPSERRELKSLLEGAAFKALDDVRKAIKGGRTSGGTNP